MKRPLSDLSIASKGQKPKRPRGPLGLLLYGILTILGGVALVAVAD